MTKNLSYTPSSVFQYGSWNTNIHHLTNHRRASQSRGSGGAGDPINLTPGDNAPFAPELKVRFCEALAETGLVTVACRAVGKHRDTIYAHLRTDALFAAACDSARFQARYRLADRLLEDSIEGSVEHFYRDGVLVGERRFTDNRLAYAMLRRLDKIAEGQGKPARDGTRKFDPKLALRALETGSEEDLCAALAGLRSDTSDDPPFDDEDVGDVSDSTFGSDRVWQDDDGFWWTDFPPPQGYIGEEQGRWGEDGYARECTDEECEVLDAARAAEMSEVRADEEAERDTFFAELRADAVDVQQTLINPLPGGERAG